MATAGKLDQGKEDLSASDLDSAKKSEWLRELAEG
jgi:hypothetical protein